MFTIFLRNNGFENTSLRTYPELRYVRDNIKHNIFQVRKFAIDLKYRPQHTSVLEKLLINYCPSTKLDDFYFFELVNERAKSVWCRALGMTSDLNIGKAFRNDLHLNGDEFYYVADTDIILRTMDKNEKLKWLLEFEPLKVLYTKSNYITYEFRQKHLDLNGSFIVMEFDPVKFFMGYKYWVSILGEEDNKSPYLYITKFVLPGMIRSRTQFQLLNNVFQNTNIIDHYSKEKVKLDLSIENHDFNFKLLYIDRPLNKSINDYLNFMGNRRVGAEIYLNTIPFISFKENEKVTDFLLLKGRFRTLQTRWVKWLTRAPIINSLFNIFGENGKSYNREFYTGFKYEMEQFKNNGVPLPKDTSEETKTFLEENFYNIVETVYGENYNPRA